MVLGMVLLDMELLLVPARLEALTMPDTEDERLMLMDTELFLQLLFLPQCVALSRESLQGQNY